MAQWYTSDYRRFREEREALASSCPLMILVVAGPNFRLNSASSLRQETAVAYGTYLLRVPDSETEFDYKIALVLPSRYPRAAPIMFCDDPKLPIGNIERHIMPDGMACLGVQADIGTRWRAKPRIVEFLDNLAAPFLAWQVYFDIYATPPPWGARSHYKVGILEHYAEIAGMSGEGALMAFIRLLARKNPPKGHELCPCGSGEPLRKCHKELLQEARRSIAWEDAAADLEFLLRPDNVKQLARYL